MRTTITVDEHLLAQVKQRAAATGRTVSQTIEDSLRETLQRATHWPESRVELLTWHGGKPLPGVDLDGNTALLDLLGRGD